MHTNLLILEWVKAQTGAGHIRHRGWTGNLPHCKESYCWTTVAREATQVIEKLRPFLRLKNQQAELALQWQATVSKHHRKISATLKVKRDAIAEAMRILNRKGTSAASQGLQLKFSKENVIGI